MVICKNDRSEIQYKDLCSFFIPLALSSSLTSVTHVIINGTLSRGENAAFIIACYAVAFSLFGIIERPIIIFRQTSSALVKNVKSFKTLTILFLQVTGVILVISFLICYTFVGDWLFIHLFNASESMVNTIAQTFKVITVVVIFSGIRGIYQGVIINQRETKWITIGVILRVVAMILVAYWFIMTNSVSSIVGAAIFLIGMFIEALISVWKGHRSLKKLDASNNETVSRKEILQFYSPLVFFFFIQTMLIPLVYIYLAKTQQIEVSIASFALAYSICQLILSFFMFTHQIVLQYYQENKEKVIRFMIGVSSIPTILLILLTFTPLGTWFMRVVMGTEPDLTEPTLHVLAFFIIRALVFPWVDFLNGYLMLKKKTARMLIGQFVNLLTALITLIVLVTFFSEWNGVVGAIAISLGELTGLLVVLYNVYLVGKNSVAQQQEIKMNSKSS